MHWKGLRLVADGSSKRQSTIESQPQGRRSEHLPRPLAPINEPRYSESTRRFSDLADAEDINTDGDGTAPRLQVPGERGPEAGVARAGFAAGPSTGDTPSLRRNRFSFMRLRHASDPQLSKSYAKGEETPPVPSLPRKCTHYLSVEISRMIFYKLGGPLVATRLAILE
jgi:hypothetical protein